MFTKGQLKKARVSPNTDVANLHHPFLTTGIYGNPSENTSQSALKIYFLSWVKSDATSAAEQGNVPFGE